MFGDAIAFVKCGRLLCKSAIVHHKAETRQNSGGIFAVCKAHSTSLHCKLANWKRDDVQHTGLTIFYLQEIHVIDFHRKHLVVSWKTAVVKHWRYGFLIGVQVPHPHCAQLFRSRIQPAVELSGCSLVDNGLNGSISPLYSRRLQ